MSDLDPTLGLPLASRGVRLVGQFVDGLAAILPAVALAVIAGSAPALEWLGVFMVVWPLGYYLFADGLSAGRSFAKQWLGLRVVSATSGAPCTFWQSFVRNVLLAILGPLDWVFIFGPRRQRLGDIAAGTVVVRA